MVNELSRPALFLNLSAGDASLPRRFRLARTCHRQLAALRHGPVRGRALGPESVDTDWDKRLGPAMREHGRAVDEEAVAATLMRDLEWTAQ